MSSTRNSGLPIETIRPQLKPALAQAGRVLLQAPTGSGKSTQIPQMLVDEGILPPGKKVVVLQPRRLATRMLARRVASERGGRVGGEVGYRMRFESVTSADTRIEFVTEGVLFRQLTHQGDLADVGAIIFDEFHERHLYGDLGLALAKRLQQNGRSGLHLVVMSATLDVQGLEDWLSPSEILRAEGRQYPVTVEYAAAPARVAGRPVWEHAAHHFKRLVSEHSEGDFLVFMPGGHEIRKTVAAIKGEPAARAFDVLPLYGDLPPEAQDAAVTPGLRRKVVVATNVAETSLTIEGVRVVIDSGLARVARFDPHRGIDTLWTEPVSQASAEQRTGRAGRTAPGHCLRMWGEREHASRSPRPEPEIARVDLCEIFLGLMAAGVAEPEMFSWFEAPPPAASARALDLLHDLGAVDAKGKLTPTGSTLAGFPLHPRFTRMLMQAEQEGCLPDAALLAALCQGRPLLTRADTSIEAARDRVAGGTDADAVLLVRLWQAARDARFEVDDCRRLGIHAGAARQAGQAASQFMSIAKQQGLRDQHTAPDPEAALSRCLLAGFSDRVARREDPATRRVRIVHGRRGELRRDSIAVHAPAPLLVAAGIEEVEARGDTSILLDTVCPVTEEWLREFFPEDFAERVSTIYDPVQKRVEARRGRYFRDLLLEEKGGGEPDQAEAARLLADEAMAGRIELKRWNERVEKYIRRIRFAARHCPELGIHDLDTEDRRLLMEQICLGAYSQKEVREREVLPVVREWLSSEQQGALETLAPEEMELPRRKRPFPITYAGDGSTATLAARVQDFYDVRGDSLRIAGGRVHLRLELLAPNNRPVQVTEDIDAFWQTSYPEVRKQLKGRYPKHEWR